MRLCTSFAKMAAVELPVTALLLIIAIAVERLLPIKLAVAANSWLVR